MIIPASEARYHTNVKNYLDGHATFTESSLEKVKKLIESHSNMGFDSFNVVLKPEGINGVVEVLEQNGYATKLTHCDNSCVLFVSW